jgi:hypothetical protein
MFVYIIKRVPLYLYNVKLKNNLKIIIILIYTMVLILLYYFTTIKIK